MKLERVVIPVTEIDSAEEFYGRLGWTLDAARSVPVRGHERSCRGSAPDHASDLSSVTCRDPDGNGWLLQEVTARLPERYAEYMVAEQDGTERPY
jgi:hypothetical protein